MANFDFSAPRLFLDANLTAGSTPDLDRRQAHYLVHDLRLREGGQILVVNGRHGEWRACLLRAGAKAWRLEVIEQSRPQPADLDLHYLFVPLKQARLDYMVQKVVEMGAGRISPVVSDHAQVRKVSLERMRANAIEAVEQCGLLVLPKIDPLRSLGDVIEAWPQEEPGRRLVFCDEAADEPDPVKVLSRLESGPLSVLVGPEGGFSEREKSRLREAEFATALPLGPRILRADTAAVAVLAVIQSVLGDWRAEAPGGK